MEYEIIINSINVAVSSIFIIAVLVFFLKECGCSRMTVIKEVQTSPCKINCLHFYYLFFQGCCEFPGSAGDMAAFGCCFTTSIGVPVSALYLIADLLLLVGSIKQDQGILIGGLVLNGISILGLILALINLHTYFISVLQRILIIAGSVITVVFKIWAFVIGVGALQEVDLVENLDLV